MPTGHFILASASPRRRQLLEQAGHSFTVRASHVDEPPPDSFPDPVAYATYTAWLKATRAARPDDRLVLGADTIVSCDGIVTGKAVDRADAKRILERMSGAEQDVLTGVCLVLPRLGVSLTDCVATRVRSNPMSPEELERYLDSNEWVGKAGAYGIQDQDPFVSVVEGSFSNVVGLPIERLAELLSMAETLLEAP